MASFGSMSDDIKLNLETQLKNIELQDKESQRILERQRAQDAGQPIPTEKEPVEPPPKVDTYQVEALSTMVDDYENIINKNYCVYTNYEDFSFA